VTCTRLLSLSLLIAAPGHASGAAPRCSRAYFPSRRAPDLVWFLGRALPDTLYAGPGPVRTSGEGPGHAGPFGTGAFRGQLVSVERLDPQAERQLGSALRAAGNRVVLVAWDYDAACRRMARVARADWIRPGTGGLYEGVLRPREFWAGDLPTLDVFTPELVPYPSGPGLAIRRFRDSTIQSASAEQMFEYLSAMPSGLRLNDIDGWDAWLQRWARDHAELAGLSPIREVVGLSHGEALRRAASYHRIRSPIAGTWRLVMTIPPGDSVVFFARTAETPISAAYDSLRSFQLGEDAVRRPPFSYDLYARFAAERASLDSAHAMDDAGTAEGYFELATAPLFESRDSTVWRGGLPVHAIPRQLFKSQGAAGLRLEGMDSLWLKDRFSRREGARFQARFVLTRDGRMRGEDRLVLNGVPLFTIRAERIEARRYPGEMVPRGP